MARYADKLLAEGEVVSLRTRQHWLAPVVAAAYPLILVVVSLVVWVLSLNLGAGGATGSLRSIVGYAAAAGIIIGVLGVALVFWRWSNQDYIVTNHRVLKVEGIFNKHSADSSLEKINDAVLDQSIWGRMFGFGDLDIMTASEETVDRYKWLNRAPTFKKEMLNQKNNLEMDMRRMPSPPLRASAPAETPAPAAPTPPPAAAGPMSADQVTATLDRLADLRDRGAVTPEEYEAKKAELLDRL
jgi:Bacterial PH domain/Short C-terminal domain